MNCKLRLHELRLRAHVDEKRNSIHGGGETLTRNHEAVGFNS
jgi:hypothetical protein